MRSEPEQHSETRKEKKNEKIFCNDVINELYI